MKNQKSEAKRAFLVLAGGSLMLLGCIIPDKSATAPSVAPGSARRSAAERRQRRRRQRRRAWRWGRTAARTR